MAFVSVNSFASLLESINIILHFSSSKVETKGYRLKVKIETTRHYDEKGLHLDFYLNLFNDNKYNINRFR
jgi:hypothetical protein